MDAKVPISSRHDIIIKEKRVLKKLPTTLRTSVY